MLPVFEVKTKAPEIALSLGVNTSVSLIDKFLDGTGYQLTEVNILEGETNFEMVIENDDLDIEISAQLHDIIVKGFDDDISIYSQQAFDLRYVKVD